MLIDSDADGVVTATEFAATFQTLRFRDLDNDQTLSVAELVPYRDPRSQQAALTPDAASLPFFHVTDADSARLAAERIVRRYGDGTKWASTCSGCPQVRRSAHSPEIELAFLSWPHG